MVRLAAFLLFGILARGQTEVAELLEQKTLESIRRLDAGFDGALGVAVIDLTSGRKFSYHGDAVFPQASVIKIPILLRMFQAQRAGQFHFTDRLTLTANDAVGGSGRLQYELKRAPVTLSIDNLVTAMIEHSDNTATNRCIELVGMESVNRMLDELGLRRTRLRRKMMDAAAAARNDENVSTPVEMAHLVERIYRGEFRAEILAIMKKVSGGMREGLPLDIETATKTGELPGARGETGIVFLPGRPFVLSVMSAFIDDRRTPVPEVTRIVYHLFEKLAPANRYGNRLR